MLSFLADRPRGSVGFANFAKMGLSRPHTYRLLAALLYAVILASCGQPMPPTGGPRDSLPPVLLKAEPGDSSTRFQGNRITLTFDEYIQLDNPFEKLVYSPVPKVKPEAEGRLKNVVIRIKDTLEENTTYSIDFDDAIRDINENNPLRGFRYVFSTGQQIDTDSLVGRVFYAESGKTDSLLQVILHPSEKDSAVAKRRPRYATRTRADGSFAFRFLAPGSYHVFALKDADGGLKYDQESETFGFLDSSIRTNGDPVTLLAFVAEAEKPRKPTGGGAQPAARNREDRRLRFSTNLEGDRQDLLGDLVLQFENRLVSLDTARFALTDTSYRPLTGYRLELDSTARKLTLSHRWTPGTRYRIITRKDFARDTLGFQTLRNDTLRFETKRETDYGNLSIRVTGLDTTLHPVLLIYKEETLEKAQPLSLTRYRFPLFRPGEFGIRILYDRNRNGRWDTGDYWRRLQPERVVLRKQKLNIRAGWDNELEINLTEKAN